MKSGSKHITFSEKTDCSPPQNSILPIIKDVNNQHKRLNYYYKLTSYIQ